MSAATGAGARWYRFYCYPRSVWREKCQVPSGTPIADALRGRPDSKLSPKARYKLERSRERYRASPEGREVEKMFKSAIAAGAIGRWTGTLFYG